MHFTLLDVTAFRCSLQLFPIAFLSMRSTPLFELRTEYLGDSIGGEVERRRGLRPITHLADLSKTCTL